MQKAPEGKIWQCTMCGKTSPTKDGWDTIDGKEVFVGERGWDVSCFLNSVLVPKLQKGKYTK